MPKSIYIAISISLIFNLSGCSYPTITKKTINSDLNLQQLEVNKQKIYFSIINPEKFQLEIVQNTEYTHTKNLQKIHQDYDSLLTFNGSFFSEKFTPTGLLISTGQELAPLIKADLLDGILTIDQNNQPKLYNYDEFKKVRSKLHLQFAIQNGPTLINTQGQIIISNKSIKKANRTAIGLTKDNQLVVIIDRQTILDQDKSPTLYEFADLIKNSPELKNLGIHSVLNLDGGPSTGLVIHDQYIPELDKIQNIIIIKPRSA